MIGDPLSSLPNAIPYFFFSSSFYYLLPCAIITFHPSLFLLPLHYNLWSFLVYEHQHGVWSQFGVETCLRRMSAIEVLSYPSIANSQYALPPPLRHPYESSVSSSASSSVSSIFSADGLSSSQGSVSSISSSVDVSCKPSCGIESQSFGPALVSTAPDSSNKHGAPNGQTWDPISTQAAVPRELRQNPRRTRNVGANGCTKPPPPLVRQSERKWSFVDSLVGEFVSLFFLFFVTA